MQQAQVRAPGAVALAAALLLSATTGVPGAAASPSPDAPHLAAALPPGGTFTDDDGSGHEGYIEAIAALSITRGCDAGGTRFCPGEPVSRTQMAAFLARALDLRATSGVRFDDIPTDASGVTDIDRLATAGITRGCDADGRRFCPGQPVTRAQMAAFLVRGFAFDPDAQMGFTDVDDSAPLGAEISALAGAGITAGCDPAGTRFCPAEVVTRGQMATFLGRALGLTQVVPPPRPTPALHGNPDDGVSIPPEGRLRDTSAPDQVIGDGTPTSCTSAAVVAAVARGGVITFDCGPDPVRIVMDEPAKVVNDAAPEVILDGGGLVTL
ncbi:MAG: S-layer homology domain-containing protein, partial [Nitriliruptoraceae bacterium]